MAIEIAELQAQVDRDRQDLAVYRGVIAPTAGAGSSMQVQQLRISPGGAANQFVAHLTLMQGGKPDTTVAGIVGVRVTGQLNGVASVVEGVGTTPKGAISFRYYQAVDYQLALPAGFHPAAVQVTVHDKRPNGITATQSFPWERRCSTVTDACRAASTCSSAPRRRSTAMWSSRAACISRATCSARSAPTAHGESSVSVGEGGVIDRGVVATHVVVNGIVRGDVQATGKVALGPSAQVLGNVQYGTIESAAGARIAAGWCR